MNIYIPYTYLIGWSKLNTFYYGRRTAKNCHPNEFWNKYFTSSKYVKEFVKNNGEPDIIEIRKTFPNNPKSCCVWECKVLGRMDVQHDSRFLNNRNGDHTWDTTGMVSVYDENNKIFCISNDHPDYLSGKYNSIFKGKVIVKDINDNTFVVSVSDPMYISGELKPIYTGTKQSKETIEKRVKHIRGIPKSEEHNRKNSESHKGKTRFITDEWKLNISNGMKSKPKLLCPNCTKEVGWHKSHLKAHINSNNCKRINDKVITKGDIVMCLVCLLESNDKPNTIKNHGIYCKQNPDRIIKTSKSVAVYECPICGQKISGKGNLKQHQNGSKCSTLNSVISQNMI